MKGEVRFYAVGIYTRKIWFPNGEICCDNCTRKRQKFVNGHVNLICIDTYEPLNGIDTYHERGQDCPLEIQEEITDGKLAEF